MKQHYSMSRIIFGLMLCLVVISQQSRAQTRTISKAEFRDKTLAMIIGSLGGTLTGYEFLHEYNTPNGYFQPGATRKQPGRPLLALPDDWFVLMGGTLGNSPRDEYNYPPWIAGPGRINSDDDQHIDFFNQYLLNKFGLAITYEDIKNSWMHYRVSDFGGGGAAIEVMRDKDLMAPQCGHRDHGNHSHWLPECYIEHEMMGAAFPGMPNKAVEFTEKLSSITGEGENVQWGYYWAAAHAIAFFETDSRVVVEKALGMLPGNCRPRQMYAICKMLRQKYPNDWRAAVRELWTQHWSGPFAVGYDKVMEISDVNNGTGFLSILYGNNDYMEVLKIASLAGGDGDCTASAVCGIMGILKGMAGTPQKFKDDIWANGNGIWINDVVHAFSIKKDWKLQWRYDELVDMFQQNAEMTIRAYGGVVTGDEYIISTQSGTVPQISSPNWDFETGDLSGWKVWRSGGESSIWNERQCNDNTQACWAATGKRKGTILIPSHTAEAKLYQTITGLKPGATYKIEGRINTGGRVARLYAENYGGPYQFASIQNGFSPFPFVYLYVTMGSANTSLDVGLHVPPGDAGSRWCSIDDVIITELENYVLPMRYEAEAAIISDARIVSSATASGGSYVGWINNPGTSYIEFPNIMADYTGEHILRISYANAGAFAQHKIIVNDRYVGLLEHSDTGPWGVFSANVTDAYVKLNKGENRVRIEAHSNFTEIDYVDVVSPYGREGRPATDADLVDGGIYRILSRRSGKALEVRGAVANGSTLMQNTFSDSPTQYFRIRKTKGVYYIQPLGSNRAIEILGSGTTNGNQVALWDYWGGDGQQWAIIDAGDGYFKVLNHKSGKALDVAGSSMNDEASIIQWDYLNAHNQQWRFDFLGTDADMLPHRIPGRFEAEDYSAHLGIGTEPTTDIGGGRNVMDINRNEWTEYSVFAERAGTYEVRFRVASATVGGTLTLRSEGRVLGTVAVPGTGGWQSWTTVSTNVQLKEGFQTWRLDYSGTVHALYNVNWIEALPATDCDGVEYGLAFIDSCGQCAGGSTGIDPMLSKDDCLITGMEQRFSQAIRVYPNPFDQTVFIECPDASRIQLLSPDGRVVLEQDMPGNGRLNLNVHPGVYMLKISRGDQLHTQLIMKQ